MRIGRERGSAILLRVADGLIIIRRLSRLRVLESLDLGLRGILIAAPKEVAKKRRDTLPLLYSVDIDVPDCDVATSDELKAVDCPVAAVPIAAKLDYVERAIEAT